MSNKKTFTIFLCLTAAAAGLVIYMGSRVSLQSYGQSSRVLEWVTGLVPAFGMLEKSRQVYLVRRMAHAFEYGVFSASCLVLACSLGKIKSRAACGAISLIAALVLALCDELLIQANTAGRSGTVKDVGFDFICAFVVVGIGLLAMWVQSKRQRRSSFGSR